MMTMTMKLGLEKSPKNESDLIFGHDGTIRYFSRNLLTIVLDGFRGRRSLWRIVLDLGIRWGFRRRGIGR